MVKRWSTPSRYDRPESHLEFFLKIPHVHGQKMIDTPQYHRPGSHLEFFSMIQYVHGEKIIAPLPPSMTDQYLTYNF